MQKNLYMLQLKKRICGKLVKDKNKYIFERLIDNEYNKYIENIERRKGDYV
ncbi:hypothetical protein EDD65_10453 [Keratinibaculum paraultunense]|uniref:Uncharacterized protein n=1 Tax=Keratinibaculum paraultunense TaxID=1278232 RepID=A0A4R3L244_9FIRM|nr:hypothetical protein [Keratinibaculum paraultunense]QQY78900.1 hypothetical protein JL105_06780 [Keratinibaculum paraultunense]TCS90512.1 hypothetical protein EDD65_10453 [Keratinibaculum paraultunense]